MRFLIIGAGGIGCYYGARLIAGGHDVCFVARGEHLKAMQEKGLEIRHDQLSFNQPVVAMDSQALVDTTLCKDFDLIILTLKSGATADILQELKDWLGAADSPVLSLQNGVDNEPLIAEAIGQHRTLGGIAIRIAGHIIAPAVAEVAGPGEIVMGCWPNQKTQNIYSIERANLFADLFNQADIKCPIVADIRRGLWRKLVINNGVNPLSALTGLDTGTLTSHPVLGKTVYQMMEEVAAVASADDVTLSKQDVDEMHELISTFDAIKTSMLVDREKGRPLELDGISGAVLARADKIGVDTPVTRLIHSLLSVQGN